MHFPVVIHKDKESDYGVSVPDLPGCFSAGKTMEKALEAAREAIECHIEGMMIDGEPVPEPGSIEVHKRNPEYKGGVWAVVPVGLSKLSGKARRVNITLPERALEQLDRCAKELGESRSGLLLRAALEYIARHRAA